jgi:Flp pilus assembly protein TadB
VVALRSMWHARRRGETPDGAWLVGLFTIWLAIAAGVWLLPPVGAIFVGIVGFFVSAVLINRNPSRG